MKNIERIIVALDVPDFVSAIRLADKLDAAGITKVKVGLELFTAEGPQIVSVLRSFGFDIMLDLKLHDIPNTVARTVAVLSDLDLWGITVHTGGGSEMLSRAVAYWRKSSPIMNKAGIIGITVLTSLDRAALEELGSEQTLAYTVLRRAKLASEAGVVAIVASPQEAGLLAQELPQGTYIITPGIRLADSSADDQKRIATPGAAIRAGATHLVIGRAIRNAPDVGEAVNKIVAEMDRAHDEVIGSSEVDKMRKDHAVAKEQDLL